jgi:uncharacterized protein YwqG
MADKRVVDAIRQVARECDTPEVIVEAVVARLLPSIRLVPQQPGEGEEARLGGCRIGGLPDLPAGVEWPRLSTAWKLDPKEVAGADDPLPFLLQIDLAEAAPFDLEGALPKTGLLSFFFYWERDEPSGEADVAYIHFSRSLRRLRRVPAPDDLPAAGRFRGLDLVPHLEWTVASPADTGVDEALANEHLDLWNDLEERVAQCQGLEDPQGGLAPAHRLLGHPQLIQAPGLADGTRLLLQVDSDPPRTIDQYPRTGMMWGDCGRVYYLVNERQLRAHRLTEKPWAMIEMC